MTNSIVFNIGSALNRFKRLWQLSKPEESQTIQQEVAKSLEQEPFVVFPCDECEEKIIINTHIYPGQAVVTECDNCKTSWTFFAPQLVVKRTKEIPEQLQEKVWGELSQ